METIKRLRRSGEHSKLKRSDDSITEDNKIRKPLLESLLYKYKGAELLENDDFQGLVNLGFLILVAGTLQLVLSTYFKRGFAGDFALLQCIIQDITLAFFLILGVTLFSFSAFFLEKFRVNGGSRKTTVIIYSVIQLINLIVPVTLILIWNLAPMASIVVTSILFIFFMKMHSYIFTNEQLRSSKTQKKTVEFPNNVTFGDYAYFLAAPSLVYETDFMRTDSIRWLYAIKEFAQCLGCFVIIHVFTVQFMFPVLKEEPSANSLLILVLRLATPSIVMWVLGFYAIFHCLLNGISEILCFADRQFYLDWWNSPTLEIFWRKWNLPVHKWLSFHVYRASKQWGTRNAILLTFLMSAVVHEIISGVAFKAIRPWFFIGMCIQVPGIIAGNYVYNLLGPAHQKRWGNILVWSSLFFGQPLIEILYFSEWFHKNQDFFCLAEQTSFVWF